MSSTFVLLFISVIASSGPTADVKTAMLYVFAPTVKSARGASAPLPVPAKNANDAAPCAATAMSGIESVSILPSVTERGIDSVAYGAGGANNEQSVGGTSVVPPPSPPVHRSAGCST